MFSLVALIFAALVAYEGSLKRRLTVGGVGMGLMMAIAAAVLAAGLAQLMLMLVRGAHHELGSVVGRALYNEGWYVLAVVCITVGSVATAFGLSRRWFGAASLASGALLIPLALAITTGWYAPGVSMLFVWPVVFAIGATRQLLARPENKPFDGADLAIFGVLGIPVVLILTPPVWAIYIGLNISAAVSYTHLTLPTSDLV